MAKLTVIFSRPDIDRRSAEQMLVPAGVVVIDVVEHAALVEGPRESKSTLEMIEGVEKVTIETTA